MLQDIPRYIK